MGDHHGSYPLSSGKQGTLFQRNPVCRLSFRVCTDMCEEYGGLGFNLMKSLEVADQVCAKMVQNAWEPDGVDYYYQWIENQLNNTPAIMCACATVYVSIYVMEDAPAPLKAVGNDMKGLIFGEANRILENLRAAAYNEDLSLSVSSYGQPPPEPPLVQENRELKELNNELIRQVIATKQPNKTMSKEDLQKQFMELLAAGKVQPSTVVLGDNIEKQINIDKIEKDAIQINISSSAATNESQSQPSSVSPESNSGSSSPASDVRSKSPIQRGPKTQFLFADLRGNEDLERTRQEAERITKYIADHHLGHMRLDSKSTNRLNLLVACFWYRWNELGWVANHPQGAALHRFVTEHCHIPCDVTPKTFSRVMCGIINSGKKDPEYYAESCSYFPELIKNNRN